MPIYIKLTGLQWFRYFRVGICPYSESICPSLVFALSSMVHCPSGLVRHHCQWYIMWCISLRVFYHVVGDSRSCVRAGS